MTANENNRRYLAEAWINEEKDEEFKKSFLENLLNQLEHHKKDRSGFDADMLDGKHYCEISKEINDKVKGFLKDFSIGKVYISNDNGDQYTLGFDAITLFPNTERYENSERKLPWDENPRIRSPSLIEVFQELYNQVTQKVDQEQYDTEINSLNGRVGPLEELNEKILPALTENANGYYDVNATTINGIQIFILTRTAYNRLTQSEKEDIKKLYIIKEDDEIDTDIYTDGVVTNNNNVIEVSRYCEFRIIPKTDPETGLSEKWLQYKYIGADDTAWKDMVPTAEFIDDNAVDDSVIKFLQNTSDFSLNKDVVHEAFNKIDFSDDTCTDSKPLKYLADNFISGVTYDGKNISLNSGTLECKKYLDISDLIDDIEDIIDRKTLEHMNKIYPINSIYITMNNQNPADILGIGTWTKVEGRFLLASGAYIEGNVSDTYVVEQTGGEKNHYLNVNEIPKHTHSASVASHTHNTAIGGAKFLSSTGRVNVHLRSVKENAANSTGSGSQYYIAADYPASNSDYISDDFTTGGLTSPQSSNTGEAGAGDSHNNMPPYIVVNVWRRTE